MRYNNLLYNAAVSLVAASAMVKEVDENFALQMLDKAQEYKDKIKIDENIEKEVKEFEREIEKGL